VTGNVYYALIEMEMGAEINGKLIHEPRKAAAGARQEPAVKAAPAAGAPAAENPPTSNRP
jgi:cytoskeletal protein CcmA (bactofilin family)